MPSSKRRIIHMNKRKHESLPADSNYELPAAKRAKMLCAVAVSSIHSAHIVVGTSKKRSREVSLPADLFHEEPAAKRAKAQSEAPALFNIEGHPAKHRSKTITCMREGTEEPPTSRCQTAEVSRKRICLLSMPGEIRNQIHQSMVDDMVDKDGPSAIFIFSRKRLDFDRRNGLRPLRDIHNTTYIGLTQSCRMLRHEFRPLFWSSFRCIIQIQQLLDFIRATQPRKTFRGVEYRIRRLEKGPSRGQSIRVLPLLPSLTEVMPGLRLMPPATGGSHSLQLAALSQMMTSYAGDNIKGIRLIHTRKPGRRWYVLDELFGAYTAGVEITLQNTETREDFYYKAAVVKSFRHLCDLRLGMGGSPPLMVLDNKRKLTYLKSAGQAQEIYSERIKKNDDYWWGQFES